MRIGKITIPYGSKHTEDQVNAIIAASIQLLNPTPMVGKSIKGTELFEIDGNWGTWIVDLDKFPHDVKYTIEGVLPIDSSPISAIESIGIRPNPPINHTVNVAIPGFGLMAIDDVTVEYDLCTDTLRGRIEDGWRILAICPQPDQRRPDYVLGRAKSAS